MNDSIELSITVKDSERTLTRKEVLEEGIFVSRESPYLFAKVQEVVQEFSGDVKIDSPDIIVRLKMTLQ